MKPDETNHLVDIWLRASLVAHDFVAPDFWRANVSAMRDEYLPASETWVIEEQGRPAGFYSLSQDKLAAIFVSPELQGCGLGKLLLDHAKKQRDRLTLTVYTRNKGACAFYAKHGFLVAGEQLDAQTGCMEYLMTFDPSEKDFAGPHEKAGDF
ncbi:GNAT family N-acetyltransferase [Salidesulfovibrio brasiliensis]|uniref:GNAT family N-acetyltransferase n=1 Tax=Salidesulfovibrio brasiliensis TaxID=221711 RepID=UPI001C49766E|nr:GNAT family N-acetyltransferase [Salidesulfovibrio brasiliensis]